MTPAILDVTSWAEVAGITNGEACEGFEDAFVVVAADGRARIARTAGDAAAMMRAMVDAADNDERFEISVPLRLAGPLRAALVAAGFSAFELPAMPIIH